MGRIRKFLKVAANVLSFVSILLGSAKYPNNSLQLQVESTGLPDGGCCRSYNKYCCSDPCEPDPPEIFIDPLIGIPKDDASLTILLGLQWPRRDFAWSIQFFKKFLLPKLRGKRQAHEFPYGTKTHGFETPSTTIGTTTHQTTFTKSTDTAIGTTTHQTTFTSSTDTTIGTTTHRTTLSTTPITSTASTTPFTPTISTTPFTPTISTTPFTSATSTTPFTPTISTTPFTPTISTTPFTSTTSTTPFTSTTSTPLFTSTTSTPLFTSTTSTPLLHQLPVPHPFTSTTSTTPFTSTTSTTPFTSTTSTTPFTSTTSTTPFTSTTSTTPFTSTTSTTPFTSTTSTTPFTSTTSTTPSTLNICLTEPELDLFGKLWFDNPTDEEILEVEAFAKEIEIERVVQLLGENTKTEQSEALEAGKESLREKELIEKEIFEANITFSLDAASLKHQLGFRKTDPISTRMALGGFILIGATKNFATRFNLPVVSVPALAILCPVAEDVDLSVEFKRTKFEVCFPNNPYRTLDGSCNNIANVLWGAAFTSYRRDLYPAYNDGVSTFRKSVTNIDLPSARLVSLRINTVRSEPSPSFSILHMTFGQFIDHDIIKTPLARPGYYQSAIKCCNTRLLSPECAPIEIPPNDNFYKCYDQTCMEFVRSASFPSALRFFPREQGNEQSSYLDGSVIYGVKPALTKDLRSGTCGLLQQQVAEDGRMLLPKELNMNDGCNTPDMKKQGKYCFKSGDGRTNEQVLLTFFQTLFAREHNRIAKIFCKCHGLWNDEKIFQETRKIVWALLQQITYNEYLPTIIGPALMAASKLYPLKGAAGTNDYNMHINAAIGNNFATAAFRFGHSLITDNLLFVTKHGKTTPKELSTLLLNPFELYRKDGVCEVARGGLKLPQNKMDPYFTPEITGKLFRGPHPFGLDLLAVNIQRGRDHGLPSYNKWRKVCGLPKAWTFNDLRNEMSKDRIEALESVYQSVEDIDLYVGGISENPIPGGILGHTFTCLIHNQFFRMKYGDRYWFEYKNSPGAFTPGQLEQLHNANLAMVMCNNLPELKYIQRYPLRNSGPDNPRVRCKSIRRYSLKPWAPDCLDLDPIGPGGVGGPIRPGVGGHKKEKEGDCCHKKKQKCCCC